MAQATSFRCDGCGERIEDMVNPVIVYYVTGPAPMHPIITDGGAEVGQFPLSARVRAVLAQKVARRELCAVCHAWEHGDDLLDENSNVVVAHSDHVDSRESFHEAHNAIATQTLAQLARDTQARSAAQQQAELTLQPTPNKV